MTAAVLGILLALWPLLTLPGGGGFAPLIGLAAILTGWVSLRRLRPRFYMLPLFGFLGFAAASVLWSPQPTALVDLGFTSLKFDVESVVQRVGLLIIAGGALIAATGAVGARGQGLLARLAVIVLLIQLVIVALLTIFEDQAITLVYGSARFDEGVQNISRNCLIMAAAAPFLILGLIQGKNRAIAISVTLVILAIEVAILVKREVYAGLLALVLSGLCIGLIHVFRGHGFRIIGSLVALAILSAPAWSWIASRGADVASATSTIDYRQVIWDRTLDVVAEKPLMGAGVGALRAMRDRIEVGEFADQFVIPNHPHNMPLQLWAETGAIGALLLATAVLLAAFRLPPADRLGPAAPRVAALAGAAVAVGCVSFDLWNAGWWAITVILALLAAVSVPRPAPASDQPS